MANKIQLRRGQKSKLPTLSAGEPSFTTDTREFFIGTGSGNVNMGGSQWYFGSEINHTSSENADSYADCPQVKVGDIYLNTTYGYIYQCTTAGKGKNAKWAHKGTLGGAAGAIGGVSASEADDITLLKFLKKIGIITQPILTSKDSANGDTLASEKNQSRRIYCYKTQDLPEGSVFGILTSDWVDINYSVKDSKGITHNTMCQQYDDYVTGKTFCRDLEGFVDDGEWVLIDGSDTFIYWPWYEVK